jgi:PAS domain S-box-containing protein
LKCGVERVLHFVSFRSLVLKYTDMDVLRQYSGPLVALVVGPLLVYGVSAYLREPEQQVEKMETSGPPLMLGKSLTKKDQIVIDMLNSPEHLKDCWVITDPSQNDNPIIYASPGFCSMTGYSFDEIIGRNCRFLQGEGTDHDEVSKIRHATETQTEASVCLLNYRKDGTPFNNQFFITPLYSEDGSLAYDLGAQKMVEKKTADGEQQDQNLG